MNVLNDKCRSGDYSKSFYELPHFLVVIACDFFTQMQFANFHLSRFDMYGQDAID